jgi:thiol-disulfide isomerase/thioredoxin
MKQLRLTFACAGILSLFMGGLQARDYKLEAFQLGEVLFGAPEATQNLAGKVVVIEFWGVQCPPCIKKMPHLAELHDQYEQKGLRLIGAEMQRSSSSRIEPIIKKAKVNFPITKGCVNPIGVNRLPHMAIFDVDGKLVYEGYPSSDADEIIKKELAKVVLDAPKS